ncbi:hypothetical protein J5N97_002562 [Dioscorea zingiberensis]|uniref:IBH1-like N-terminal domain-containing protein n=1 Tax=Dioscorea zingiberensis TaxID=325984 RepID=A0A9D5D2Z1_9LILI|nr:hypothetical protein J5N97_002562 [Dioscorea zingiberensis]
MEEEPRRKRRRVCAIEPNELVFSSFPHNYVSQLLPALLRVTGIASSKGNKDEDMEKTVRFEVDMALATSAGGFKWSNALKHTLEQQSMKNAKTKQCGSKIDERFDNKLKCLFSSPKSLIPKLNVDSDEEQLGEHSDDKKKKKKKKKKMNKGSQEDLGCRMRKLRRIVPGGEEMNVCELLSEMESYVMCLQMQVYILKSLVANH